MPSDNTSSHNYQEHLGAFNNSSNQTAPSPFDVPPVPPEQESMELLNPVETLDVLRDTDSSVRKWLSFIRHQYTPPEHVDVLLLYPCAAEKPMTSSKTYRALENTLAELPPEDQRRVHVVTVSEPMGLIPVEFQDGETFLYDCPGLFGWWCQENDEKWDVHAQKQCLQILGEHIAGFISRAVEEDWYNNHIACVRHMTAEGNESRDQTHRQMLEIVESTTDADLQWLPREETVESLVESVGTMAWQMMGCSHQAIQIELGEELNKALDS